MNANSQAIITFCSALSVPDGVSPLNSDEWSGLAEKLTAGGLEPKDIVNFSVNELISSLNIDEAYAQRLNRLTHRSAALFSAVSDFHNEGIYICTRADRQYPSQLKRKLGAKCPPLFYCAGNINLLGLRAVGYMGCRDSDSSDEELTRYFVKRTCGLRLGVVSLGSGVVASAAACAAMEEGRPVIEYVSCGLSELLRKKEINSSIAEGKRLILSDSISCEDSDAGRELALNRYICVQSEAVVIMRSGFASGATWEAAKDNLRSGWSPLFCRRGVCEGNSALIESGAIAIDESWNLSIKTLGRKYETF